MSQISSGDLGELQLVQLGIDIDALHIQATIVTTNEEGSSPVTVEPLAQIPSGQTDVSFKGDGAYDIQDMHEACHHLGAIPITPLHEGARLRKELDFAHRNNTVKAYKLVGRSI